MHGQQHIKKKNQLLSYTELHAPCIDVRDKVIYTVRGKKKEFLNVKTDGT